MGKKDRIEELEAREWHQRYQDLDQKIGRFRNGYTAHGSPERHDLDRILADKEGK